MTEFVSHALPEFISNHVALAYAAVFLAGVMTSLGPCNLSMVPVIIATSAVNTR